MSFLTANDDETIDEFEAEFDDEHEDDETEETWRPGGGIRGRNDLPPVVTSSGGGVSQALISTPEGQARVQLSRSVVSQRNFDGAVTTLRTGINRGTSRLNELQREVSAFSNRIAASTNRNHRQLRKLRNDTAKWQKANTTALAKARKEAQNSTMMVLLVSLLGQDGNISNNDTTLLALALMGMGGGGYGGGDNNMMPLLVLLLSGGFNRRGRHHHDHDHDRDGDRDK